LRAAQGSAGSFQRGRPVNGPTCCPRARVVYTLETQVLFKLLAEPFEYNNSTHERQPLRILASNKTGGSQFRPNLVASPGVAETIFSF